MARSNHSKHPKSEVETGSLGTFPGVFTPSILTILGIILFLRMGYVVGSAGLGGALLIIGLANAISVLTSFSLSAIATNLRVKGYNRLPLMIFLFKSGIRHDHPLGETALSP